ncbi:MAG: ABC transporter permease, partial [Coriobacteriia bacterium]|nr:ABC transporter permease [Coriobacteriia bacterium]
GGPAASTDTAGVDDDDDEEASRADSGGGGSASGSSGGIGSSGSGNAGGSGNSADTSASSGSGGSGTSAYEEGTIREVQLVSTMFDTVQQNDLSALKKFLESPESRIRDYVNTIQYEYDVTPQIYLPQTNPETHQVHPDSSFTALGMGSGMTSSSIMSMGMSTNVFHELLTDISIYSDQYEVLAGDWPQESGDILLVLGNNNRISDYLLYPMGLRDYRDLNRMVEAFINEEPVETSSARLTFTYADIMDVSFKLVYNSDYYRWDETYEVWVDHRDDEEYEKKLVENGKPLRICGIVTALDHTQNMVLSPGLYYTSALVEDIVNHSAASEVTKYQLARPNLNIFTNKTFLEEANDNSSREFDMSNLFEIDEEALTSAFDVDMSGLSNLDFGGILDPGAVMGAMPEMDMGGALAGIGIDGINIDPSVQAAIQMAMMQMLGALFNDLSAGYIAWIVVQDPPVLPSDPGFSFADFMMTPEAQAIIDGYLYIVMNDPLIAGAMGSVMEQFQAQITTALSGYMQGYMITLLTIMSQQIAANMSYAMSSLADNMASAMNISPDTFMNAFQFNLDEAELTALMLSMMSRQETSLDNNLRRLGYADFDKPNGISLYPFDFEGKQEILNILDDYNARMEAAGKDEQVITYTDIVGTLMRSVTSIIDMISMVLVAFVAISLVVSSIMIGVITYISVLERKKEIGILRSVGASKGDIANVFNAETLIVGFVAGVMGIAIVLALSLPVNAIIMQNFSIPNLVLLPWMAGLILVGVSCFLTFVAGLLPSSAASRKDPVEALRSE